MKQSMVRSVVTNVVYGVIALVPVAILALLLVQVLKLLGDLARPLALQSRFAAALVVIGGLAVVLLLCFLLGMLIRTRLGASTYESIERRYLRRLPGYEPITSILRGFAQKSEGSRPVVVSLFGPGTWVFGLMVETNGDGTVTVFVPAAPTVAVGSIHVVGEDRVRVLDASFSDLSGCISQWGIGSRRLLARRPEGT